ncbi:hypothetical protein LTR66_005273, partial [Elasticomyces elasticus]
MQLSFLLPILGLIAFALYKVLNAIVTRYQDARRSRQLGCEPLPRFPDGGFLGIKLLKRMITADKEFLFPSFLLDRSKQMAEMHGRPVGSYQQTTLGQAIVMTSDPKNIQALLSTQFDDFGLGEARRGNMMATLGDGIFVQDGKAWEHSRALIRPSFVRDQVSDLDLEERHVQNMMRAFPAQSDGWTADTNLQTLFFRLTLDSATEFLFGSSVDSQIINAPGMDTEKTKSVITDENTFASAFDVAQKHLARRFRFEANKNVNDFVDHFVQLALRSELKEKRLGESHKKEKYVFLDALAAQTKDPVELRAQILNILLAGRDTTASLLSWLFHLLVRHPLVFVRLRNTIIQNFGTYRDPHEITFSTLKGCQYLQWCLNETLRLWPVVPSNARRSLRATTLPRGGGPDGMSPIYVEKGKEVLYSVMVMQRRTDLWGSDADEFKPERWQGRKPGWDYLPFNGGPRIC